MDNILFDKTKAGAYFLWEYTSYPNTMSLWYCTEDISCFFDHYKIENAEDIREIVKKGIYDEVYVRFVRQIAYRIYEHTRNENAAENWYNAERLLMNGEWCSAMVHVAKAYRSFKNENAVPPIIKSEKVRNYYMQFGQES